MAWPCTSRQATSNGENTWSTALAVVIMPAVPTARVVAVQPVGDRGANRVEREHVQAGDGVGGGFEPGQVRLVGVGLAEADQAGVGVELDDRAQRVRLVHADGVQQRRVDERDRGDAGAGDANLARRHRLYAPR